MQKTAAGIVAVLACAVAVSSPRPAEGFNYIEHSYFTDRACLHAQRALATHIDAGEASKETLARYLALSLTCPERWEEPYCADGDKQPEAGLNRLTDAPRESGELAVTLGDFAALPDHLSRFGPIRRLPRLGDSGLVYQTWRWVTGEEGDAGGVIGDVAADACEVDGLVPWGRVEHDVATVSQRAFEESDMPTVPESFLSPLARDPVLRGPTERSGAYSFDNPHYLDLVLRNHSHFGAQAYGAWTGYHSAAVEVAQRRCEEVVDFDDRQLGALADDLGGFEQIVWAEMRPDQKRRAACAMLRTAVDRRLRKWVVRADPQLVQPVLDRLQAPGDAAPGRGGRPSLDGVVVALTSLVMEGSGLHYLQDGLASGHMRTLRSKGGLDEVRYDHDTDNREGVAAVLQTRSGNHPFVAFGDSYLLGPTQYDEPSECDWESMALEATPSQVVSSCLIQHQRGLLVAATSASLIDWALGGTLYDEPDEPAPQTPRTCRRDDPLESFVCRALPARPTRVGGEADDSGQLTGRMRHGSLPVTPPSFGYDALSFDIGLEATGEASQFGLHLTLLEELDERANWLMSHRAGLRTSFGDAKLNQFLVDYGYGFHFRWSARFLIDARPEAFAGLRGLDDQTAFFAGLASHVGVTALPEGWTKLPLELTVGYRFPLVVYGSDAGFFGSGLIDGHWILLGLGLAYM